MRKNKSWVYVFATMAILVITGFIFITRERPIPPPKETGKEKVQRTQKAPEQDSGLTISGRVNLSDGSPASKAKINLTMIDIKESFFDEIPLSSATADINGKYSIAAPDIPFILVKASYPGYANRIALTGTFTSRGGSASSEGKKEVIKNFVLPPASYIKGRVLDENDNPIQGVSVSSSYGRARIMGTFSFEKTVTDNQGGFDIQNIPSGKITLTAASLDHTPQRQEVTAPAENIVFQLLPATGSLSGRVFYKTTGESVTSATVRLGYINQRQITNMPQKKSMTDRTGFFSFDHLASGQYYINAQKDDLLMFTTDDLPNNRLKLKENEKKEGMILYLYEGHTIKGRVTDKNTGAPLEGVKVSPISEMTTSLEDITDPDGFYMFRGLSGANVVLTAEKENYILYGEANQRPFISVNLDPDILESTKDLQMIPGLFISGRVETDQGSPPENAKVYLYQGNDRTTLERAHPVDQLGMFKLMVQPFTICYVNAKAEGYPIAFSDPIDIQHKSIDNVVVVIKQASAISGIVRDGDNKPIQGAEVQAQFSLDYGNRTSYEYLLDLVIISDSKGAFKAENLPSGKIVLTVEKDCYAPGKQVSILLNPGKEKTNVILQLTRSTFLAGKITDPEGNPLENIRIFVNANISGVRSYGNDTTDEDGRYRIEDLYNAPHKVTLRQAEYCDEYHQEMEVGREDSDFVFNLKTKIITTLIGNVKDWKTGNPIVNFNVSWPGLKPEKVPEIPGRFVVKNLNPEMRCKLKIESEGYVPLDTGYFSLPENENSVEKTFELGPGGSVRGRVVNKATREPMEGVGVHLFTTNKEYELSRISPAKNLITQKDGLFNFETIPPGAIFIRFSPEPPLSPKLKNVTIKHGDVTDMGDVEITGGGVIRDRLVQMPDEIPIPGKTIILQGSSGAYSKTDNAITDDKGRI